MNIPETTELRVLLLEDSVFDAEIILRELKQGGLHCVSIWVQTGPEFERAIIEFQPTLILSDYKLPTFDGGQALAIARVACPDVPLIIISGAVGEETAVDLLKNGSTDFVLKDRLNGRLVPAVRRALREVADRQARQQAEADFRALNEQLEQRVAERTRELWAKNAIMEEDLGMARELQLAFLPKHFPTFPRGVEPTASAVKFFSIFQPTSSVSGDLFNVIQVSDTAVGIFICDVMGHGVRAALVTAMMRALEERLGERATDPGALLTEMNHALRGILRQLDATLFTTACYFIVDVANGRLSSANAGHPSPVLVHGFPRVVEPIAQRSTRGPALGLMDDVVYTTQESQVEEGDLLFAFTDGLFEVENTDAEPFSLERLHESILKRAGQQLPQLIQDVFKEIESFAEGRAFSDDVCLIGIEINHLEPEEWSPIPIVSFNPVKSATA